MKRPARAARDQAEMLAIQALGFIAADRERLAAFLNVTGLAADAIRIAANEPGFLAGVLDHLLADEALLTAFADDAGVDPGNIAKARRAFGGQWGRDLP